VTESGVDDADTGAPSQQRTGADTDAGTGGDPDAGDAQLVARAAQGEVGAFAILVHRHAAGLYGSAGDMALVQRAFQRAMRRLDRADTEDVAGWLRSLLPTQRGAGRDADASDVDVPAPLLARHELDALWAELAPRWPQGRRRLRLPRWVGQVALVLFLLVLAVTLPYLVLTTAAEPDDRPEPVAEVEGVPLDDDAFDLTFEDAPDDPTDPTETTP